MRKSSRILIGIVCIHLSYSLTYSQGKDTITTQISLNNLEDWKVINAKVSTNSILVDSTESRSGTGSSFKYSISNLKENDYPDWCYTESLKDKPRNICRHLELMTSSENSMCIENKTTQYKWSVKFNQFPDTISKVTLCQFHTEHSNAGSPALQIMLVDGNKLILKKKWWNLDSKGNRISKGVSGKRSLYEVSNRKIAELGEISMNCWYDIELTIKWSHWQNEVNNGFVKCVVTPEDDKLETYEVLVDSLYTMNSKNQKFLIGAYWQGKRPTAFSFNVDDISISEIGN